MFSEPTYRKCAKFSGCLILSICGLLSVVAAIIYFVILPNSGAEVKARSQLTLILGILCVIDLLFVCGYVILVYCVLVKDTSDKNKDLTKPFKDDKLTSYITEKSCKKVDSFNKKQPTPINSSTKNTLNKNSVSKKVSVSKDQNSLQEKKTSDIDNKDRDWRFSFAEDIFKSLKFSKKEKEGSSRTSKRRTFLKSVDEDGYHFDNSAFDDPTTKPSERSEDELETGADLEIDVSKHPIKRLDSFDRSILAAQRESFKRKKEFASVDFESIDLKEDDEDNTTVPSESSMSTADKIDNLKPFDNYLSIVKIDSDSSDQEASSESNVNKEVQGKVKSVNFTD